MPTTTKPTTPWLGELPAHWEVKRLKYVAKLRSGQAITVDAIEEDGDYPVFGGNGLRGFTADFTNEGNYALIGRQGALCGNVNYGHGKFWASEHAVVCHPVGEVDHVWLGELLRSMDLGQYSQSAAQPGLAVDRIESLLVPVPPLPEQRAIAAYLDERTARIDGLLARKRRLVELLKEKRQALITRAVTRGLDPKAKLKDSGVPWLGEVPEGWEVKRLKHICEFVTSGSRGWAEHYADEGAVFIRIGNLDRMSINLRLDDIQRVDPPTSAEVIRTRALPDDLLISITAFLGTVGIVPDGLGDAYVNQHTALIRLLRKVCHPRFVAYWFFSSAAQQQFSSASQGGTKEGMSLQEVRDLLVLQPDIRTQQLIAEQLDNDLARTDTLLAKVEQARSRLQEYRTALISAAVTGKVRVA